MSYHDLYIMIGIGVAFVILGVLGFIWGKVEEGSWYGTVSTRIDVREFVDRTPGRPEPGALRIGGKICIAVGVVMLLISAAFFLWGMQPPR
jgi:nitrogen fixation-related uncharacterized protein